jgi:hypothetical protein
MARNAFHVMPALLAPTVVLVAAPLAAAPCAAVVEDAEVPGSFRLRVTGPLTRQVLNLTVVPNVSTRAELDCNADGDTSDASDVDVTLVEPFVTYHVALGGYDTIRFEIGPGVHVTGLPLNLLVELGPGANAVTVAPGGDVSMLQGGLVIEVFGGSGPDTLTVTTPTVTQARFSLVADLGAGNDVVAVNQGGAGSDGSVNFSDFRVAVNLGTGNNTFSFQQRPGPFLVVGQTPLTVSVEGGSGRDTVSAFVNAFFLDSPAELAADLGPGNDTFNAEIDLANFSLVGLPGTRRAAFHLDVDGGPGSNALTVTRNGTTTGGLLRLNDGLLDVRLKGGLGADAIGVDLDGNLFDAGGEGIVRLRLDGGAGSDTLSLLGSTGAAAAVPPPVHDAIVTGGPGNDAIVVDWDATGFTDPANYGPHGRIVVDGVGGTDTCTVAGANLATRRGCEM